jgi:hypothetical protein
MLNYLMKGEYFSLSSWNISEFPAIISLLSKYFRSPLLWAKLLHEAPLDRTKSQNEVTHNMSPNEN